MEKVYVIGAGFMGGGIAQVFAQAGYSVKLNDSDPKTVEKALAAIRWSVEKLHQKGFLPDDAETIMDRLTASDDLADAADSDWVIEAVFEDEALKHDLFTRLEKIIRPDAVLASNTSSIPITRLAAVCDNPERVIGLHFFGPVPLMALVEVIKSAHTSEELFERAVELIRSIGKTPVRVRKDIPMFVMNRIFTAAFSEAADLVAEGVVTPEDVDIGMRLGYGWNVGPFEIADNAGLDTFDRINRTMESLADGRMKKGPGNELVGKLVSEGRLGRKVGKGFYKYVDGKKIPWDEEE